MLWNVDGGSSSPLHEQIAANVRRAIADGVLAPGERLPPAGELAALLQVNANTALAAYRRLRAEGILEFRRGRGVRVRADSQALSSVTMIVRELLELGRKYGYTASELAQLVATFEAAHS
jgi:DNA-binding transcriptional regulator YhcF (GntR family)